jgi:hypothetical protein
MLKHPAIVALAAAVFDLLALGPVPDDPDGPQAAIDEAVMGKLVRCVDAAGAVVDDLSEAECHEAMALIGAAEKKDEGAPRSGGAPHRRHQDVRSLSEEPPARLEGVAPQPTQPQIAPLTGAGKLVGAHRRPLDHARPPLGELLMTCNTSAVAVCCSNASRVLVIRCAFSMAMTACAAKFCNSAICFGGIGPHAGSHSAAPWHPRPPPWDRRTPGWLDKQWMNQGAFLMRGLEKVRGEFSLTALAYNLRRVLNIVELSKLIAALPA